VDNDGKTLVAATVAAGLTSTTLDQLKYLHKHGADCAHADAQANTPLHHVAMANLAVEEPTKLVTRERIENEVATFMIATDKSILNAVNAEGFTALDLAVAMGKTSLALTLARVGGTFAMGVPVNNDDDHQPSVKSYTFLHRLVMQGATLPDKDEQVCACRSNPLVLHW
jgi:ankyrin repeat protein